MKHSKHKSLGDIGEKAFLKQIFPFLDTPSILNSNDDASAFSISEDKVLIINADMLVAKTDVLPGASYIQIGRKAVTMSISDLIAKGVQPLACLASVCFPPNLNVEDAKEIIAGIKNESAYYNSLFLGGDLNQGEDIIIDIISFGISEPKKVISRRGIKEGDLLFSTGYFGWTGLGFKILLEQIDVEEKYKKKALRSVYEPKARKEYLPLFESVPIKASIDSSDGLYASLNELCSLNNLGISITTLPVEKEFVDYCSQINLNPLELVMNSGEEFELLFVVDQKYKESLVSVAEKLNLDVTEIGYFTSEHKDILIKDKLGRGFSFKKEGFEHFKS